MAISLIGKDDNAAAFFFVEADKGSRTQGAAAVAEEFSSGRIVNILIHPGHRGLSKIG